MKGEFYMFDNQFIKITNYLRKNYLYCPKCNERLKAVTYENSVRPNFNEKSRDFLDSSKVKAYRTEFRCPRCRLKYTLADLKRIENHNKRWKSSQNIQKKSN
jgi:uncharacterized protein with PIN domain